MLKSTLFFIIVWLTALTCQAQSRLDYLDLLKSDRQAQIYFEHSIHPSTDSLTEINVNFRIENDFIQFTKGRDNTFKSEIKASLEIYDKDMTIIRTKFWTTDKTVDSYEKTTLRDEFVNGRLSTELTSGIYYYILKFQGSSQRRELSSDRVKFTIGGKKELIWSYFINKSDDNVKSLINYGGNAIYGKDFEFYITFKSNTLKNPLLKVEQISIDGKDTTVVQTKQVDTLQIDPVLTGVGLVFESSESLQIKLQDGFKDIQTLRIPISNKLYSNSDYRIKLFDSDSLVFTKVYQSFWYDMPLSLLSINVSIAMLEYIMPIEKLRTQFSGNEEKKIASFNKFWQEKDPSPGTEFNELLYEYYRRIDYAYKEFSSPRNPGFETDMGEVYIKFGPPIKKERSFPSTGYVVETWKYQNRTFAFKASSGFGDFELIK